MKKNSNIIEKRAPYSIVIILSIICDLLYIFCAYDYCWNEVYKVVDSYFPFIYMLLAHIVISVIVLIVISVKKKHFEVVLIITLPIVSSIMSAILWQESILFLFLALSIVSAIIIIINAFVRNILTIVLTVVTYIPLALFNLAMLYRFIPHSLREAAFADSTKIGFLVFSLLVALSMYIICTVKIIKSRNTKVIGSQDYNGILGNADALLEYKKLLDDGAITQEEFEAKKKELLNL